MTETNGATRVITALEANAAASRQLADAVEKNRKARFALLLEARELGIRTDRLAAAMSKSEVSVRADVHQARKATR